MKEKNKSIYHPSTIIEDSHEPPSLADGEEEEEDLDTLDMDSRESTDGCCDEIPTDGYQDNMDTSTNGCSSLYVGDIEIPIEDIVASTHSFEH